MVRVDQCVFCSGAVSNVRVISASTWASVILRGSPASVHPPNPPIARCESVPATYIRSDRRRAIGERLGGFPDHRHSPTRYAPAAPVAARFSADAPIPEAWPALPQLIRLAWLDDPCWTDSQHISWVACISVNF